MCLNVTLSSPRIDGNINRITLKSINLYKYKGHSINLKYCLRSWQLEVLFIVGPFSRKSIVMDVIMAHKALGIFEVPSLSSILFFFFPMRKKFILETT